VPYTNYSTAQFIENEITPKLATAIRLSNYKHSTFVRHKLIRALPNATAL